MESPNGACNDSDGNRENGDGCEFCKSINKDWEFFCCKTLKPRKFLIDKQLSILVDIHSTNVFNTKKVEEIVFFNVETDEDKPLNVTALFSRKEAEVVIDRFLTCVSHPQSEYSTVHVFFKYRLFNLDVNFETSNSQTYTNSKMIIDSNKTDILLGQVKVALQNLCVRIKSSVCPPLNIHFLSMGIFVE